MNKTEIAMLAGFTAVFFGLGIISGPGFNEIGKDVVAHGKSILFVPTTTPTVIPSPSPTVDVWETMLNKAISDNEKATGRKLPIVKQEDLS